MVYANVEAAQFAKILNRVSLGRDSAVSLRTGHRMALLARYAPDATRDKQVGSTNISAELARALSRSPISGYYVTVTAMDQVERGTAYQRVGAYPLTVLVGLSTDTFLAGWRRQVWEVCGLLITIAVTVAAFSVLMFRAARREMQQQQRISRLAAVQSAMLDNELVGISRVRDRHTIWKNRAMERIFGYGPGELDGTPTRILFVDDASYDMLGAQAYPILHAGGHYRTQMLMRRKDGTPVWVDANSVQLAGGESMWMMVDITAMKEREAEVSHLAFHDVLTGLLNRALLPQRLNQVLIAAGRSGQRVAVCYLDLDGFKAVNDQHGHDAGDALLLEVAARLKASVRSHDIVARMGGDEFVIVLASVADAVEARHALERLLARLQEPITVRSSAQVSVGASIGIALAPEHGQDSATLVAKADQAMLDAKRAGKNRIAMHGDEGTPTAPREAAPIG